MLAGYDLFRRDRPEREGGGALLCINSNLHAVEFVPDSNFPEKVWCQIQDSRSKFLIGVYYRTNWQYISTLHSLCFESLDFQFRHFRQTFYADRRLYSFTQWPPALDIDGLSVHAKEFCDCLDDNFLVQHITTPARNDKILDLVITDKPDMITDVCDLRALASSNHHALQWRVSVETESNTITRCRPIFDYARADYGRIKAELA